MNEWMQVAMFSEAGSGWLGDQPLVQNEGLIWEGTAPVAAVLNAAWNLWAPESFSEGFLTCIWGRKLKLCSS